jgi:hypothetical protein
VRKIKKGGVAAVGTDGLPLYNHQAVLGGDCGNKDGGYKLNYYWRIAERCGWDGPAPLGARQAGPCGLLTSSNCRQYFVRK